MVLFLLPEVLSVPIYGKVIAPIVAFLESDFLPGTPNCGPIAFTINLQKCTTLFYNLALMYYFKTDDHLVSWVYLSLHGTYGLLWYLKECVFPDPGWQRHATLFQHVIVILFGLGPYWYFSYSINSRRTEASYPLICACISVHTLGCVLMMAADSQKFFVLKAKKGLITDGWFSKCRNTNYLGEMMIYGSYAALSQDWVSWAVLLYIWTGLFGRNMMAKEARCQKKDGGAEYIAHSWMIWPRMLPAPADGKKTKKR